jgi:hypothetical protein
MRAMATVPPEQVAAARARFGTELLVAVAPWAVLVPLVLFGWFTGSFFSIGLALAVAGVLFFVKQRMRYPLNAPAPVGEVASLLERLDASPISGIPVELRGQIIGRGMPGYVLSPDLVIQDTSGFVPLLYRQPISLLATLFGLFRASAFFGQEVVATGWYHRSPGPAVELREVRAADGRRARGWLWVARHVASGILLLAGLVLMALGVAA